MNVRIGTSLLVALALGACQGEKPPEQNGAAGEVLPGSASDAMLPIDTVRSQPPLAPQTEGARPGARADRDAASGAPEGSASDPAGTASTAAPSPAASATPE